MTLRDIENKIFTQSNLKVLAVAILVVIGQAYPQFAAIAVFFSGLLGVNIVYNTSLAGSRAGAIAASQNQG